MAEQKASKININGTDYEMKDAVARENLEALQNALTDFENETQQILDNLTALTPFDSTPTANSNKGVKSGGVATSISNLQTAINNMQETLDNLTALTPFDSTPTANSNKGVKSGGVATSISNLQSSLNTVSNNLSTLTTSFNALLKKSNPTVCGMSDVFEFASGSNWVTTYGVCVVYDEYILVAGAIKTNTETAFVDGANNFGLKLKSKYYNRLNGQATLETNFDVTNAPENFGTCTAGQAIIRTNNTIDFYVPTAYAHGAKTIWGMIVGAIRLNATT